MTTPSTSSNVSTPSLDSLVKSIIEHVEAQPYVKIATFQVFKTAIKGYGKDNVEAKLVQVNHVNALKHFQIIMEAGRQQRQNERSDALAFVAKKGVQSQGESEEQGVVVQQMAGDAAKGRQQQAQSESSPPKEKTRPKPRPRIETHRIITANMDNVRTTHDTQGVGITGSYTVWMKDIAKTCEKSHNTAGPVGTADLSTLVQTWKVLRQCDSAAAQACQQFIRALLAEPEGDLFADAK